MLFASVFFLFWKKSAPQNKQKQDLKSHFLHSYSAGNAAQCGFYLWCARRPCAWLQVWKGASSSSSSGRAFSPPHICWRCWSSSPGWCLRSSLRRLGRWGNLCRAQERGLQVCPPTGTRRAEVSPPESQSSSAGCPAPSSPGAPAVNPGAAARDPRGQRDSCTQTFLCVPSSCLFVMRMLWGHLKAAEHNMCTMVGVIWLAAGLSMGGRLLWDDWKLHSLILCALKSDLNSKRQSQWPTAVDAQTGRFIAASKKKVQPKKKEGYQCDCWCITTWQPAVHRCGSM